MSRVLIADSDRGSRELIAAVLRQAGHTVEAVADGRFALAAARAGAVDAVVLESSLAGMSGLAVCRRLRADADTRDLPVVLVSHRGRAVDIAEGLAAGADDYLVKSFGLRDLAHRTQTVLSGAGRRRPAVPVAA